MNDKSVKFQLMHYDYTSYLLTTHLDYPNYTCAFGGVNRSVAAATNPQLHRLVTACMARSTAVAAATNPQLHRLVTACMTRLTAVAAATNPQLV